MARMGHDSPRAALIYQHTSGEADRAIADAVSAAVDEHHRRNIRRQNESPDQPVMEQVDPS
jgi:hypothetical protein